MSSFTETESSSTNLSLGKRFVRDLHAKYIRKISADTESLEYLVSQHLRMSGVYWGLTALSLLGADLKKEDFAGEILTWIDSCYDPSTGGYGGNTGHDAHLLYTLSALQVLALYDELERVDRQGVIDFVLSLQRPDGSFAGDRWGEIDTRFSYCALYSLALLNALDDPRLNIPQAKDFILSCKNFDGGFGALPGAESHAGQIFCCVAALSIIGYLDEIDRDLLGWWLSERQCDSGGLNGRPEKQADVCYSWWILSSLSILGRTQWINCDRLSNFILECQDSDDGGIADRPGNMGDVFHTFFGICGLMLLDYFHSKEASAVGDSPDGLVEVDPTYALPLPVVARLGLKAQVYPVDK